MTVEPGPDCFPQSALMLKSWGERENPTYVLYADSSGDSAKYNKEALLQLLSDKFYFKVQHSLTEKHSTTINCLLHKLHDKGEIPDKVFKTVLVHY